VTLGEGNLAIARTASSPPAAENAVRSKRVQPLRNERRFLITLYPESMCSILKDAINF